MDLRTSSIPILALLVALVGCDDAQINKETISLPDAGSSTLPNRPSSPGAPLDSGHPGATSSLPVVSDSAPKGSGGSGSVGALPPAVLFGDCPAPSKLAHSNPVDYQLIAKRFSPFAPLLQNQLISSQQEWDQFVANSNIGPAIELPAWSELPYPSVAVLSPGLSMAGCNAAMGELALRNLDGQIHLDLGTRLNRAGRADCMGTCAAAINGFVIVSYAAKGDQPPTICNRVWPSCPLRGTVSEL